MCVFGKQVWNHCLPYLAERRAHWRFPWYFVCGFAGETPKHVAHCIFCCVILFVPIIPFLLLCRLSSSGPLSFCFVGCHFVRCFKTCRCGCTWIFMPLQITQMSKGIEWNAIYPLCTWVHSRLLLLKNFQKKIWYTFLRLTGGVTSRCGLEAMADDGLVQILVAWPNACFCWNANNNQSKMLEMYSHTSCCISWQTPYWFVIRSNFQALLVLDTDGGRLAVKYNSLARKDRT